MLGWEFPPILSGGLGVATYGIVKALRSHATIKLIVPNSHPGSALKNVTITGLNNLTSTELKTEYSTYSLTHLAEEINRIPLTVSPYHHVNREIRHQELISESKTSERTTVTPIQEKITQLFSSPEIYGTEILRKVYLYAEMADQLASSSSFDVIHAHDWVTFPAGIKIKKNSGKPLITHVHALETDRSGDTTRNEIYHLEKNAFAIADQIIAVSEFTKAALIKHYQVKPSKIHVIHNGIEPKNTIRKSHKLKEKIVVFLGRITHQKGPEFLLETAEKVMLAYPNVKFVVAGAGDQFTQLLETAAYKKLGKKFIFTGFLSKEKVDELLAMADVYFMPSVSEPFGLTALEAAQHRVPSVLSKQSGAGEVINASLKADYWDTDKQANYIYALLKYKTLHKELSHKSHSELKKITWDSAAEKIVDRYKRVISDAR